MRGQRLVPLLLLGLLLTVAQMGIWSASARSARIETDAPSPFSWSAPPAVGSGLVVVLGAVAITFAALLALGVDTRRPDFIVRAVGLALVIAFIVGFFQSPLLAIEPLREPGSQAFLMTVSSRGAWGTPQDLLHLPLLTALNALGLGLLRSLRDPVGVATSRVGHAAPEAP